MNLRVHPETSSERVEQSAAKELHVLDPASMKRIQQAFSSPEVETLVEQVTPQLERHVSFQTKIRNWYLAEDFDCIGTEIFNLSTRLNRATCTSHEKTRICHLRYASVLMLECGRGEFGDLGPSLRLLRVILKTARVCQDCDVLPLAHSALERASKYQEQLLAAIGTASDGAQIITLCVDYYMSRISLAKIEKNDQLREYLLVKVSEEFLRKNLEDTQILSIAELFLEHGLHYSTSNNYKAAQEWFERCHELAFNRDHPSLHDLRLRALQSLVRVHIAMGQAADLEKAATLLEQMSQEQPVAAWLYLLKVDFLRKQHPTNPRPMFAMLESMIRIVQLTPGVFNEIKSKVEELRMEHLQACQQVLDLLLFRVAEANVLDWLEQSLILRIWYGIQDTDCGLRQLETAFREVGRRSSTSLGFKASSAAQILIWNMAEKLYASNKYSDALRWLMCCRAPVLGGHSTANEGKIIRRLALCYIELNQYSQAREIMQSIPIGDRNLALTKFLLYKIDIVSASDEELREHVSSLPSCVGFQTSMLYQCAIDATEAGKKQLSQSLLELILQYALQHRGMDNLRLSVLLRCMIKLAKTEIDDSLHVDPQKLEILCANFEAAAALAASEELQISNGFSVKELDWFSKTGHNLAQYGLTKWPAHLSLRLLKCVRLVRGILPRDRKLINQLLKAYPANLDDDLRKDLYNRKLLCVYLMVCTQIMSTRNEKDQKHEMELLEAACEAATEYRELFQSSYSIAAVLPADASSKLAAVLVLEFEARVKLAHWQALNILVEIASSYGLHSLPFKCMADLILSSSAPVNVLYQVVEGLTNACLSSQDCDIPRLSRWLRVLFTLCLTQDATVLDRFSTRLLQVIRDNTATYPQDELQWLAAKSFNIAVDLHDADNVQRSHRMCELALTIGNYAHDDDLKVQIQRNYQQLINTS